MDVWGWVLGIAIVLVISGGLAFIPASLAKQRGYSFWAFWVLSLFTTFVIGLIVVYCNPDKAPKRMPVPCTQCQKLIYTDIKKCVKCGADAPPAVFKVVPPEPFVPKNAFVGKWLGIIVLVLGLAVALGLGSMHEWFYRAPALRNFAAMMVPSVAVAMGVVLTARAKGPDISLVAVMALSAAVAAKLAMGTGSAAAVIAAALAVCAVAGAISGVLTVWLRLPSIVATIFVGAAAGIVKMAITQGGPIILDSPFGFAQTGNEQAPAVGIVIIIAMVLAAFLLVRFSRLGSPMYARPRDEGRPAVFFAVYIIGALFAGIAGIYTLSRFGSTLTGGFSDNVVSVAIVFFAISSSRLVDNKWASVLWALFAAIVHTLTSYMMNMYGVSDTFSEMFLNIYYITLLTAALFANRDAVKRAGKIG